MDREGTDKLTSAREQFQEHICSLKIDKAAEFLSLPDIKKVNNDIIKVQFLTSKGLNGKEISEAFRLMKLSPNKSFMAQSFAPKLVLQEVANVKVNRSNALVPHRKSANGLGRSSLFVSFCQKLILIAGITSTCYYLYQKWLRWQDDRKKKERNIKEELNQIKNDLRKILMDLRHQELVKQNQNELMTEINSIKAILVSRQNFDEKPPTKPTLPSWQLAATKEKPFEIRNEVAAESLSTNNAAESQSTKELKNEISVSVSVLSEDDSPTIPAVSGNSGMSSSGINESKTKNQSRNPQPENKVGEKSPKTKKLFERKN